MSNDHDDERYLWDGSGPEDKTVARLEAALAPLRHDRPLAPVRPAARRAPVVVALASGFALAAVVAWLVFLRVDPTTLPPVATCAAPSNGSYAFRAEGGQAQCGSEPRAAGWVPWGGVLETPPGTRATLDVASLGTVTLEPSTKLRLLPTNDATQKIDLVRGTLRAKIDAPPRLFVVQTAMADAVDLGCEYELTVDERGVGRLAVHYGSVSLERPGNAPTLVTEHTACRIGSRGPGTPLANDATPDLRRAAEELDDGDGDGAAFGHVLAAAGAGDTITLWHVMRRRDPEERGRAWDRLAAVVPPPANAPREAVVRGERAAIAAYKDALLPRWFKR